MEPPGQNIPTKKRPSQYISSLWYLERAGNTENAAHYNLSQGTTKIGRIQELNQLQLLSKYISREHCSIEVDGDMVRLHNNSKDTTETYVDSYRLKPGESRVLKDATLIGIGSIAGDFKRLERPDCFMYWLRKRDCLMEYFTINLDSDSEENVHVASSSNSSSDADGNNNVLDVNIKNLEARGSEDVKSVFSNVVDAINEDSTSSCPGNHPECELSVNQCAPCKVFLHKLTPERIALLALCTTSSDKVENIKEDIICLDTSDESDQEQQQTKCSEEPETKNVLKEILDLNKKDAVLNESKINKKQNTTSLKENNEPAPKSKALGWKSNIDEKVATKRAQSKSSEHQKFTSLIEKDVDKSKPVAVQSKPIEPGNSDSSGYRLGYCQSDEKSGDKMEQNSVISKVVVANSTSFSISSTSSYNTSNSSNKPTILPKKASISRRMSCFVSKSEAELKTKALSAKIKKPRRKSTIDKSTFSRAIDKIRPRHRSSTDDVTLDRSVFVKELLLKNRELRKEKLKELAARESAEKKEIEMRAIQSGTIIVEKLTANNRCAYRTMMPAISDSESRQRLILDVSDPPRRLCVSHPQTDVSQQPTCSKSLPKGSSVSTKPSEKPLSCHKLVTNPSINRSEIMNQAELDGSIFEDSHSSSHITVKSLPTIGLKSLLKPSSSNSTSVWRKKPSKKIVFNDLKPSPIPLPPKKSLKEYLPMLLLLATQKLAPFLVFSNKLTEYKDLPRIDQQFIDHKLHKNVLSILLQEDLLEKVFYRFQHCDKNKAETVTFQQSSIEKNEFFLECTSPSSRICCDELVILTDLSPTILKPQSIVGFVQSVEVSSTKMTRFMIRTLKSSQTETIKRAASLKLQPIGYYKAELKLVRAIDMVEDFEILELIRKPLTSKPAIDLGPSVHQYRNKDELDEDQMLIVQNITNDSTFSRGTAKIFAINGSVATGKLLVVKNIIQEIFLRSNGLKILFCATSTTIVHRLTDGLDLFLRRSHQKFDLLQIGNKSSHIAASIDKRLKSMSQEPKHADKSSGEKRSFLLKQADVVCCTINDCFSLYENEKMFDICIVFEANQITDAQLMIPLLVQPKKLILVGDNHTVRPTVWSAELLKVKYQQSLFSRMVDHFTQEPENSPVYTLNTQYRMHSQISRYISKEVYGYCLLDSDTVLIRDFLLKPYLMIDLVASNDVLNEATRLVDFVKQTIIDINSIIKVKKIYPKYSIGIITSHQRQYNDIYCMLKNLQSANVSIRQVDNTGGMEKDIIIFVATPSEARHLDLWQHNYEQHHFMAFSKAKHCLLVVGEIKGLINSYWWSKLVRDAEERGIIQQIEPTEKSVPIRVLMK